MSVPITDVIRVALPSLLTLVGVLYTARLFGGAHRHKVELVTGGEPGTIQHVTHALFTVFRAAIWAVAVARFVYPNFDSLLG